MGTSLQGGSQGGSMHSSPDLHALAQGVHHGVQMVYPSRRGKVRQSMAKRVRPQEATDCVKIRLFCCIIVFCKPLLHCCRHLTTCSMNNVTGT